VCRVLCSVPMTDEPSARSDPATARMRGPELRWNTAVLGLRRSNERCSLRRADAWVPSSCSCNARCACFGQPMANKTKRRGCEVLRGGCSRGQPEHVFGHRTSCREARGVSCIEQLGVHRLSERHSARFQPCMQCRPKIHAGPPSLCGHVGPRLRDDGGLRASRELRELRDLHRNGGKRLAHLHRVREELAPWRHVLLEVHAHGRPRHARA